MKKLILVIISVIVLLTQTTACTIRYKTTEGDSESSESSEYDIPVIDPYTPHTVDDYIIKIIDSSSDSIEIIRYIGEETDITIPKELGELPVISIGNKAFADLENIQHITVPNGIEKIGDSAFSNCRGLLSVELPDSVTNIGQRAFADCVKLKSFNIPEKISVIEEYTFSNCYVLEEITLPDGITSIEKGAFINCVKLNGVTLPNNLKTLEVDAFYNCFGLTSLSLPDSLEYLGKRTFDGCFNLEEIFFKGSVYTVFVIDSRYNDANLLSAVNGEPEEDNDK